MVFGNFPKTGFCWIIEEGCAWPERTTFRRTIQDWQKGQTSPVSRRVIPHAACQPRWLATLGEQTECAKLSHCNVRCARTGTTQQRRTRRRPRAGLSSRSSAIPAASTRTTKRRSKYQQGTGEQQARTGHNKPPAFIPLPVATGGVSSTAKLSVSKTDLLGSNPSSPASFSGPAAYLPGRSTAVRQHSGVWSA